MASELPNPGGISGPTTRWAHDWYSYDDYLNIHTRYMARLLADGTILRDGVSFVESYDGPDLVKVNVKGRIIADNGVLIKVNKWLDVQRNQRHQLEVKANFYRYHAWRRRGNDLIRYCSHGLDDLHVHQYDLGTGQETAKHPLSLTEWPTLADVILRAVNLGREAVQRRAT